MIVKLNKVKKEGSKKFTSIEFDRSLLALIIHLKEKDDDSKALTKDGLICIEVFVKPNEKVIDPSKCTKYEAHLTEFEMNEIIHYNAPDVLRERLGLSKKEVVKKKRKTKKDV